MIYILHYLKVMTLDYGHYGIFLVMGNAGFISSTIQWGPGSKTSPHTLCSTMHATKAH